jgi:hypothetical protein
MDGSGTEGEDDAGAHHMPATALRLLPPSSSVIYDQLSDEIKDPSPFTKTTAGQDHKPTNGNRGKSADSPATAGAPNQPLAKLLVSTLTAQKTPTHPPSSGRHHASAAEPLPLSQKAYRIQQRFLQQARDIFRLPSPLDASCLALSEDEACALTSLHDSQAMMGTLLHMLHKTPLRVLDAFAGAGGSCIYLMHFLPPGSHIIAVQKADTAVEKGTLQRLLHNTAAFRRVDKRRICTTSLQVMAGDVRSVLARHILTTPPGAANAIDLAFVDPPWYLPDDVDDDGMQQQQQQQQHARGLFYCSSGGGSEGALVLRSQCCWLGPTGQQQENSRCQRAALARVFAPPRIL